MAFPIIQIGLKALRYIGPHAVEWAIEWAKEDYRKFVEEEERKRKEEEERKRRNKIILISALAAAIGVISAGIYYLIFL